MDRLQEIKNFTPAFRSNLAEFYYRRLRGITYELNPVLVQAMDDMSRKLLPSPEGVLELEKMYQANRAARNW